MTDRATVSQEPAEGGKGTPAPTPDSPHRQSDEDKDNSDANLPREKINPLAPPVNVEPGS